MSNRHDKAIRNAAAHALSLRGKGGRHIDAEKDFYKAKDAEIEELDEVEPTPIICRISNYCTRRTPCQDQCEDSDLLISVLKEFESQT